MSNNLEANYKENWQENEVVRPVHMNDIGSGLNKLCNLMPVYASNGSFYENISYNSSTYILQPVTFEDESQNIAPTEYFNGMEVVFKSSTSNTGDCYVNVNGLGAKQIKTLKNQALTAGSIPEGWLVSLRYDSNQDCFYILENKGAVGRNVGDFFWTFRKDDSLNGAYQASGQEFNKNDFTGDTNPYDLCVAGSLPTLSFEQYEQELTNNNGVCGYWGLDTVNQKFKLPKLNEVWVEAGDLTTLGQYLQAGLSNIKGFDMLTWAGEHNGIVNNANARGGAFKLPTHSNDNILGGAPVTNTYKLMAPRGVEFDANLSSPIYQDSVDTVQTKSIKLRPMVQLATGADEQSLANTTQCLAELPKKANIIWYADREFEYKQPNFILADKQYVTIKGGTAVRLANGQTFYTENDLLKPISEILDTGNVANGKDYYFYLDNQGQLIASLNEDLPVGVTNAVKIGGAHTLCVDVTEANAPTLLSDSFWMNHPAAGYNAGYFIPNSSWTPAFRSAALTGNKGQAFVDRGNIRKWVDIYLASGTGTSTASSYAGTISNNRQYMSFFGDMDQVGKQLASADEFRIFSEGSNQKTAIAGANIPADKKCGGYLDTAGKRMISGYFIECCCGYLWQVSRDIAATGSSNWSGWADTRRGDHYGTPFVVILGGIDNESTHCGSWATASHASLTNSSVTDGCRGVSLHLEREHA
jgi:hypothetical protein